jgi:L-amino acid N-acyltransferase YncA
MEYTITKMVADDWSRVGSIYIEGISKDQATFEHDIPEWETWH